VSCGALGILFVVGDVVGGCFAVVRMRYVCGSNLVAFFWGVCWWLVGLGYGWGLGLFCWWCVGLLGLGLCWGLVVVFILGCVILCFDL